MEAQKRGDRPSALDSNDRNEARAVVPRSLPIVRSRVLSCRAPLRRHRQQGGGSGR